LASIGKFAQSGKQSEPFTNVAKLTGDFKVNNGVARTDNLKAVIDGGTLAAAGIINLAEQTLNLQMTAVLSKDYTQTVGGTQIGGYLSTALANSKGELVIPVLVTGSLTQPRVAPDVQRMAQMKMQNLLPSTSNPGGLTTGILKGITGNKTGSDGSQQPSSGLGGILGQLGGQNNQNNQNKQNLPATDNSGNANSGTANPPQQNQPKQSNTINDIFNAVVGTQKKKPQPQQPPPEQKPPDPPQ
jgi:AsmA-like C-terminal region